MTEVLAANNWRKNRYLIADVARLGYLHEDWLTLDATYGEGEWWKVFKPAKLIKHDKYKLDGVDFRDLPYAGPTFDAVALDPPYKYTGTDQCEGDRYGNDKPMRWQDKLQMIGDGITECERVLNPHGFLLLKCLDQVCSGKVRWQTVEFTNHAHSLGLDLVERFDHYGGYRRQPEGRNQVHARGRGSTLLVFQKPRDSEPS